MCYDVIREIMLNLPWFESSSIIFWLNFCAILCLPSGIVASFRTSTNQYLKTHLCQNKVVSPRWSEVIKKFTNCFCSHKSCVKQWNVHALHNTALPCCCHWFARFSGRKVDLSSSVFFLPMRNVATIVKESWQWYDFIFEEYPSNTASLGFQNGQAKDLVSSRFISL